jgi:hypothetical protein
MLGDDKYSKQLSELNLTIDDIRHLLGIALSSLTSLRHDLMNAVDALMFSVEILHDPAFPVQAQLRATSLSG